MSAPRGGDVVTAGLAATLILALPGAGGDHPTVLLVWHAVVLALALAVGLRAIPRDEPAGSLPVGPAAAFAVWFALVLVAAVLAPYGYAALIQVIEIVAVGAVAVLAARCGPDLVLRLGWPLLVFAALEGVLALVQRAGGTARPAGTLLNTNHLAAWLGAVLLINAVALLDAPRGRGLRLAAMVPAAAGWLATGSRGAMLGAAAGGLVLAVLAWRRLPRTAKPVLAAGVVLVLLAGGWRLAVRSQDADPYRYHRLRIWRASVVTVMDAPWNGVGPRQFPWAARNANFPDGEGPLRYDRSFSQTHSDLLRPFAEYGVPGGLAMLALVATVVAGLVRRRRRGELTGRHDGALAALAALGTQALVDNPSERPALYLLVAVLCGSLLSRRRPHPEAEGATRRTGPSTVAVALGLAVVVAFAAADVAPYLAWRAWQEVPAASPLDARGRERLERARRLNPLHPEYEMRHARELAGDATRWDRDDYAATREAAERAVRLNTADSRHHMQLAWVEAQACRTLFPDHATRERAAASYREAASLSRHDPAIPIELAKFLLDTGDPDGARRAAERALAIEPRAVPPRLLLAYALLESEGAAALGRARSLVDEARELAGRWAHRRVEGPYADAMLRLDGGALARVEGRIDRLGDERRAADPAG